MSFSPSFSCFIIFFFSFFPSDASRHLVPACRLSSQHVTVRRTYTQTQTQAQTHTSQPPKINRAPSAWPTRSAWRSALALSVLGAGIGPIPLHISRLNGHSCDRQQQASSIFYALSSTDLMLTKTFLKMAANVSAAFDVLGMISI